MHTEKFFFPFRHGQKKNAGMMRVWIWIWPAATNGFLASALYFVEGNDIIIALAFMWSQVEWVKDAIDNGK